LAKSLADHSRPTGNGAAIATLSLQDSSMAREA
jgi:hypothetical protein